MQGESTDGLPSQMPVTRSFDVFLDVRLTNGWSNNIVAGDLTLHRVHPDVTILLNLAIKYNSIQAKQSHFLYQIYFPFQDGLSRWVYVKDVRCIYDNGVP